MSYFVHEDRYTQSYVLFLKHSNQRIANVNCLRQHIPTALQTLQPAKADKQRFNILSIGAGDGYMDQEILKIVQEGYLNAENELQEVEILNTAVEPHPSQVEQYKESIENRSKLDISANQRPVKFEIKPISFEDYVDTKHDMNQYDLIQAIHSFYYVESLEASLNHCYYNELGDKGLIVCIFMMSSHIMIALASVLNKYRSEDKKMIFRTLEDVVSIAEKNQWRFERIFSPVKVDVTAIFDESSEDGNLLLDFLTFEVNLRKSGDREKRGEILKLIKELSTKDNDGKMFVNGDTELILIHKTT